MGSETLVLFALDGHRTARVPLAYLMSVGLDIKTLRLTESDFLAESEVDKALAEMSDPPICLFDCNLFVLLTEGEVDDCAVSSAWVGDSCLEDCPAEDLELARSINEFLDDTTLSSYD